MSDERPLSPDTQAALEALKARLETGGRRAVSADQERAYLLACARRPRRDDRGRPPVPPSPP